MDGPAAVGRAGGEAAQAGPGGGASPGGGRRFCPARRRDAARSETWLWPSPLRRRGSCVSVAVLLSRERAEDSPRLEGGVEGAVCDRNQLIPALGVGASFHVADCIIFSSQKSFLKTWQHSGIA